MTRQQQVLLRSAPVNRRRESRRVGEVAGNATAECAAVCCCVPCTVMEMVVLAAYKVPAGLVKRAINGNRKRRTLKQKKKNEALLEPEPIGLEKKGNVGPTLEDHLTQESADTTELEEEMWARFNETGFWRSSSQRHQREPKLQTGELDRS